MAKISGGSDEKVFRIQSFLGLNESPDGDTKLKLGEAAAMRNFKITRDGSLQKRPGLKDVTGKLAQEYRYELTESSSGISVTTQTDYLPCSKIYINQVTGEIYGVGTYNLPASQAESITLQDGYAYQSGNDWLRPRQATLQDDGRYQWKFRRISTLQTGPFDAPVSNLWNGYIDDMNRTMCACGGHLFELSQDGMVAVNDLGTFGVSTEGMYMFGYNNRMYFTFQDSVDGVSFNNYYTWDNSEIKPVEGYVPTTIISISSADGPNPSGSLLERVNLLTKRKKVWLSPESETATKFIMPEYLGSSSSPSDVFEVRSLVTGNHLSNYSRGTETINGRTCTTLTFTNSSVITDHVGENTIEVEYAVPDSEEPAVYGLQRMFPVPGRISVEQYNGTQDTRIFMCCENSNKVYYSGLDRNGIPRADYFPDFNVISIGDSSENVTGMIRHYSRLIVYKENSAYSVQYGTLGLADGMTTAAFYCTPINKRIGNEAFGQVQLVLNSPRTLHGKDLYEWKNNSSYSSNLTIDERQARRISDRIYKTLATFDFSKCYCYDDNDHQEYYICYDKKALVHNYAVDAWYYYDNFDVTCMVNFQGDLYAGDSKGRFNLVSRASRTDNGEEITGYWESGAEPFDREFMRKYSSMLWLTLKPELRSKVQVTVETDRKSDHAKKTAASSLFTFSDADFRQWSFNTNRKPHITRLKIKAKKVAYYKLILSFSGENTTATVVAADMRIRYTGYAK